MNLNLNKPHMTLRERAECKVDRHLNFGSRMGNPAPRQILRAALVRGLLERWEPAAVSAFSDELGEADELARGG